MEAVRQLGAERAAARGQPPGRVVRAERYAAQRGRPHGSGRPRAILRAGQRSGSGCSSRHPAGVLNGCGGVLLSAHITENLRPLMKR